MIWIIPIILVCTGHLLAALAVSCFLILIE